MTMERFDVVVVGGGPTGVELAGALGELSRHTLGRDFRRIDPGATRVLLIEGGERILPSFAPELSRKATRSLEQLGVTVWTNTRVTEIGDGHVRAGDEVVYAETVLWAAGVRAAGVSSTLGVPLDREGRVIVDPDLSVPGHSEVFVIGDQASFRQADGSLVPGVAPAGLVRVFDVLMVLWIAPNVIRQTCLALVSSYSHYYGDIPENDVFYQNQIMDHPVLWPMQLYCFNFGSTHIIHHFVVQQPFYLRQMVAKVAHAEMLRQGVRRNDFGVIRRANRWGQGTRADASAGA